MPRELTKTVRLEGGALLSPKTKKWQRQFNDLPKEQQKELIARGAVRDVADDEDDEEEQIGVADLADHLDDIDDIAEIRTMAKTDKRKTAAPIYERRIKALEAPAE